MKRVEIRNIEDLIKRLDLSKVDKETAKAIMNFHLAVFKEDKITTEKMTEVREMLLTGREKEISLLTDLRTGIRVARNEDERQTLVNRMNEECKDVLAIEKTMQEKFNEIGEENVEIAFTPIPMDGLLAAMNANEITYNVETMEVLHLISC